MDTWASLFLISITREWLVRFLNGPLKTGMLFSYWGIFQDLSTYGSDQMTECWPMWMKTVKATLRHGHERSCLIFLILPLLSPCLEMEDLRWWNCIMDETLTPEFTECKRVPQLEKRTWVVEWMRNKPLLYYVTEILGSFVTVSIWF